MGNAPTDAEIVREREHQGSVAAQWLEKYWEPIHSEQLRLFASPAVAAGWRLEHAAVPVYREMVDLLTRQARERERLLTKPLAGRGSSLRELARREEQTANATGSPRLVSMGRVFFADLGQYEDATDRFRASAEHYANARYRAARVAKTRALDAGLAGVASDVAGWIRARHRGSAGRLDGRTSWRDVETCLRWHGHSFGSDIGQSLPARLRQLVRRWRASKQPKQNRRRSRPASH